MKLHWQVAKDLFPRVFDDSFRFWDFYDLWSATFSPNFKHDKGNLYRIRKATKGISYHTFHTADELQDLPIDASLKKICKALGSKRFLAEILDSETVDTVRDRSMEGNRETTVTFDPYYDGETFFDAYGNGKLKMYVRQFLNGELGGLYCSFSFIFKKEGENLSLTRYDVLYSGGTDSVVFRFLKKPQALPRDLFPTLRRAGLKINDTYRSLFDKRYGGVDFEEHSTVRVNGKKPCKFATPCFNFPNDMKREMELRDRTHYLLQILPSKAFFEGIFGREMRRMLEKYNRCYRYDNGFEVNYAIKPLKNGEDWQDKENPDQFEVYLRISDSITYTEEPVFGNYSWDFKVEDFNFIGFRFIFDIEENKISDVEFCDKLCLNGESITQAKTEETTWDL